MLTMPSPASPTPRARCLRGLVGLLLAALVAACGGGGDSDGDVAQPTLGPASNDGLPRIEPYERVAPRALRASVQADEALLQAIPVRIPLGPMPAEGAGPRAGGAAAATGRGGAVRIGVPRTVASTADAASTAILLDWQPLPQGGRAAALTFRSDGAAGLRLGLEVGALPPGAVLSVHGSGLGPQGPSVTRIGAAQIEDALARNLRGGVPAPAARVYWTPPVAGEEATLQIQLPAGVDPSALSLAVPRLSHLWWTHAAVARASQLVLTKAAAASCNIDVSCEAQYSAEARSVARVEFVASDNNTAYLCTGTLLADVSASQTPYFLTANHCVGNQAEASTVATYWFFRAASCNSDVLDPAATRVEGGATLLHASGTTDVSFLRLSQSPPAGALHAGSLVALPALNTALAGLHHPRGDWLKLSEGTLAGYGSCVDTSCRIDNHTDGSYLALRWTRGTTEEGSSGSSVFATVSSRRYVVGHLFAGSASCTRTDQNDFYGRFDRSYPQLRTWLGSVPGT